MDNTSITTGFRSREVTVTRPTPPVGRRAPPGPCGGAHPDGGLSPRARDGDPHEVMILRGVVVSLTVLVACLLGAGVATAAPAPAAPRSAAVPCRTTVEACVRLSTNHAWLLRDGKVVARPVRVSHGRTGFKTPPGTF